MDTDQEEDIYIIPNNYQDNGKIFGIIEQTSFYIGASWLFFWMFIMYIYPSDELGYKVSIYLVIAVFPSILVFVGIGHDTLIDFVTYYIQFKKNARIHHYEKTHDYD